jgi:hypothetical protein
MYEEELIAWNAERLSGKLDQLIEDYLAATTPTAPQRVLL